jgi:hypothetical protein
VVSPDNQLKTDSFGIRRRESSLVFLIVWKRFRKVVLNGTE